MLTAWTLELVMIGFILALQVVALQGIVRLAGAGRLSWLRSLVVILLGSVLQGAMIYAATNMLGWQPDEGLGANQLLAFLMAVYFAWVAAIGIATPIPFGTGIFIGLLLTVVEVGLQTGIAVAVLGPEAGLGLFVDIEPEI